MVSGTYVKFGLEALFTWKSLIVIPYSYDMMLLPMLEKLGIKPALLWKFEVRALGSCQSNAKARFAKKSMLYKGRDKHGKACQPLPNGHVSTISTRSLR